MKTKFSAFTVALFFAATSAFGTEGPVNAPKNEACCPEKIMPVTAHSRHSLHQLDVKFTDDAGRAFSLGKLQGQPVVLMMFFASCGYACPLLVTDLQTLREKLPTEVGELTKFVLVSFDVARDTPAALARYRTEHSLGPPWILLHGDDDAVRELAAVLGVKYQREADGGFAHSNVITLLNREGEIIHQRIGLKGGIDEAARALTAPSEAASGSEGVGARSPKL